MIKSRMITQSDKIMSCDNCGRVCGLNIVYDFIDTKYDNPPHTTLVLCEDCSNAIANLHYKTMEDGKSYKYVMDEIVECYVGQ